jgi:Protein of unknown function (DUF3592)
VGAILLIGLLFVLIGLLVLIGGAVTAVKQSRQFAARTAATGKVVGLVKRVFKPGSAGSYCPVVEFMAANGEAVRFESDFGTMPASHRVGQSIAVRYDPADPTQAEIDSPASRWLAPGCMIVMGLGFLGLGLALILMGIIGLASGPA